MRREDSLQARLYKRLQEDPAQNALAFYAEGEVLRWQTFEELYARASARAGYLSAQGVHAGDVCVVIPENDDLSVINLLAVILLGAKPLCAAPPIMRGKHSSLRDILVYIIRKTRAKAVLAGEHMQPLLEGIEAGRTTSFHFGVPADAVEEPLSMPGFPKGRDVAAMQLTSGTTGFPKICVWSQTSVVAALDGMAKGMKIQPDDVSVNWTPLYHDMGLVNNFLFCMVYRIPLVMFSAFEFVKNPVLWLRALSDSKATMTWSPNFGFALASKAVTEKSMEGIRLDGVHAYWNAAERIHLETIEAFHKRFSPYGVKRSALKMNHGMAEMIGGATFSDPDGDYVVEHIERETLFRDGVAQPVDPKTRSQGDMLTVLSVGRPYPGLQVKIMSARGRELPDGAVGEIVYQGPAHMDGYLGDKYETTKAMKAYGLRTGDMGYQRNGEVFWAGRLRERITMHGKKYDPSDFEKPLLTINGLRKGCFAVFGIQDERLGTERLILVAEKQRSNREPDRALQRKIAGSINLSLGVKPDEVILLDQGTMTKTSSGKRRHRYYRELYQSGKLSSPIESTGT
jgi:acyl-CoA synthetase (AMP-forming)/AMP-acid ligase II